MPAGSYLAGAAFFLLLLGGAAAAARILVGKRFAYLSGVWRVLALSVLSSAGLLIAVVAPAALGVLTRGTSVLASALLLVAAWALPSGGDQAEDRGDRGDRRPPASGPASVVGAGLAVGGVLVYESARVGGVISHLMTAIDMLGFHLPGVARFIQTGTIWRVDQFLPGFATAQYPNNGDFVILSTVLPWHDLAFARWPAVVFLALTGVGVYALSLELGASRAAGAIFAAAAVVVPALSGYALEGLPDDITLSMLAIGVAFLARHARTGRRGELMLGGLALGVSLGTKWFGFTACLVVLLVWAAMWLLARRAAGAPARGYLPRVLRDGGVLVSMMACGGGLWLVRNLLESGNPLYPKAVSALGVQLFAGSSNDIVDLFGYTIADYLGRPGILREYVYPGFKVEIGIAGLVLLAGLALAICWSAIALRRAQGDRLAGATLLAVALASAGICVIYVVTPGSAYGPKNVPLQAFVNIRWLMPAVVLGAAACAAMVTRLGRWGLLLELAGLAAVVHGIELGRGVPAGTVALVALILSVLAATLILARRAGTRRRMPTVWRLGMAAGAILVVLVAARVDQRAFDKRSYAAYDPVLAWIDEHARSGHRIGITGAAGDNGLSPILAAFGPRLGNEVSYVGDVVRHSVEVPARESSFRAELARGRYDLLMIGLADAGNTEAWVRALGYRLLVHSDRLALYDTPAGGTA